MTTASSTSRTGRVAVIEDVRLVARYPSRRKDSVTLTAIGTEPAIATVRPTPRTDPQLLPIPRDAPTVRAGEAVPRSHCFVQTV